MNEYLISLISVSALISLSSAVLYREEKEGRAVKCAFAVLLLYILIMPLLGALKSFDPEVLKFDTGAHYPAEESGIEASAEEGFVQGIRLFLADEFSLEQNDIEVKVTGFDFSTVKAEKITIILKGSAAYADFRAVREKIEKNGFGSCEVEIAI